MYFLHFIITGSGLQYGLFSDLTWSAFFNLRPEFTIPMSRAFWFFGTVKAFQSKELKSEQEAGIKAKKAKQKSAYRSFSKSALLYVGLNLIIDNSMLDI